MGCANSREKSSQPCSRLSREVKPDVIRPEKVSEQKDFEINENTLQPELTHEEILMVKGSWDKLHSDIVRVGVVMFTR